MNIGGGSKVAGGLGALAAGGNAIRIAIDLKQSMGEAGRQLMEEYMNATGGPGGYVQTTANQAGYVWDPNATSDTPGFIEPGKNFRLSTGEYLYYTNELDIFVSGGFKELERSSLEAVSYKKRATNWLKDISFSDVGHCLLDFAGMIPLLGAAADAINVGWYLLEGNGEMAAYSIAAVFGGSAGVIAAKYGGAITKVTAKVALNVSEKAASRVNKVFGLTDEVLSSADDVAKQADEVVEGAAKTSGQVLSWGANAKGHLIRHADVLGFAGHSPQELQKMLPQLMDAANQIFKAADPLLTRVGRWHGHENAIMYISNGKMLVTEANGTFITIINKTSNNWYNLAVPLK